MALPSFRDFTVPLIGTAGLTGLAAALALSGPKRPVHWPDMGLLAAQPLVLKVHVLAAVAAFLLGCAMFMTRKGARLHRIAGWAWVVLMLTVAGSSLFLTGLNGNVYSLIHLLSGWVLVATPAAVYAARRHKARIHARAMTGLFLGGMIVAGAFTFLPGRLMWNLLFA